MRNLTTHRLVPRALIAITMTGLCLAPPAGALTREQKIQISRDETKGYERLILEPRWYFEHQQVPGTAGFEYLWLVGANRELILEDLRFQTAKAAVRAVAARGVQLPARLRIYSHELDAKNYAFTRVSISIGRTFREFQPVSDISYASLDGNPGSVGLSRRWGSDKRQLAAVIHELGHILYEQQDSALYWENKNRKARPEISSQVSPLADFNVNEFVTEVFALLVLGEYVPADVLSAYDQYRGPAVGR